VSKKGAMFPMRFLLTANFNIEADTEEAAEDLFEAYLANTTILNDSNSVAFECIEAVMADDDPECEVENDGIYMEGPDAKLGAVAA
jgi:hypothetical protein